MSGECLNRSPILQSISTSNFRDFLKFILMTKILEKIPEFSVAKQEQTSTQAGY